MWDLKLDEAGLVTVVVQDRASGEVRMLAHANPEALEATRRTGLAHFFSRSRGRLWKKGEESGNTLRVFEVWLDCDRDAVLYLVDPHGPTCHTGAPSCFFDRKIPSVTETDRGLPVLAALAQIIERRKASTADESYTRSLLDKGPRKIGEKLREEADELANALESESDARVVSEAADLVYHALVGLKSRGLTMRDVSRELARRFGTSGHDEKASRD